jgi:hypothetical protein
MYVRKKNSVIFGQVVSERNISSLFSGERDSDHYDALLPAEEEEEEEEKLCILLCGGGPPPPPK